MALTAKKIESVRETVPVNEIIKGVQVRVNFNISEETRKRWKIESISRGITMADLITEAVESYLAKK